MLVQHDVLVATARADGETAYVVGVEFADVLRTDENFVGGNRW